MFLVGVGTVIPDVDSLHRDDKDFDLFHVQSGQVFNVAPHDLYCPYRPLDGVQKKENKKYFSVINGNFLA